MRNLVVAVLFLLYGVQLATSRIGVVHMETSKSVHSLLTRLTFCSDCSSEDDEGSLGYGLQAALGMKQFKVSGELVYALPNYADIRDLVNRREFSNRIVMCNRGKSNLIDKVTSIYKSGAVGVIIVDDGQCDEKFSQCGPRGGSATLGGFAPHDSPKAWGEVGLPVVLVTAKTADRIRTTMTLVSLLLPGYESHGLQNMSVLEHGYVDTAKIADTYAKARDRRNQKKNRHSHYQKHTMRHTDMFRDEL